MIETKTLEVYYHEEKVGTLAETPDRRIAFQNENVLQLLQGIMEVYNFDDNGEEY